MSARAIGRSRRRRRQRWALVVMAWLGVIAVVAVAWAGVHESMPAWYARMWYPLEHEQVIREEAARNDLDPALVAAVINAESGFVADSRSGSGAVGLMQILPSTAEWVAAQEDRPSPPPRDLEDPETNIAYGTHLLAYLRDEFGSIPLALAAYNAGAANVEEWQREAGARGEVFAVPEDVPFPETRSYVAKVQELVPVYRRAYGDKLGTG